ncbi:hypothetical protein [Aquipseudomonas alcaligenes]|uniref:Uncharacterized protein n=1 Tax=Aquipseudomonas alcaligenes TaxID=43263 RepID=A0A1N6N7D3_AQUAC|nr:hypothetical protein [Pseudomonas alcaligenes]SIP87932.1 hypothetical protein SAMN05878282_10191 [Pseudomonas alcaligenes]
MNKPSHRYLAVLTLSLLLGEARADYRTVDELVKDFNQVSAQIARGELQAAEAGLDTLRQRTANNDVRIGQYQRELASAYLQQGRQQLQAGDKAGAGVTLAKGERHLASTSPAFRQQYQVVVAESGSAMPAAAPVAATKPQPAAKPAEAKAPEERREDVERRLREAEATIAKQEAERARQQQLAEEKAAAEREAAQQAAAAQAKPAPAKVEEPQPAVAAAPRARLIDPNAASSSVPLPMLDANDRDSLRDLLDQVAADVVAFDCAVRLEVRAAKDYPFVAALLTARIKKLDPGFSPQFSPVLKPDQEPRLVLSPQSNG